MVRWKKKCHFPSVKYNLSPKISPTCIVHLPRFIPERDIFVTQLESFIIILIFITKFHTREEHLCEFRNLYCLNIWVKTFDLNCTKHVLLWDQIVSLKEQDKFYILYNTTCCFYSTLTLARNDIASLNVGRPTPFIKKHQCVQEMWSHFHKS